MTSVFVTGSSDGIGQETARQLVKGGHRVVLHARDETRAKDAAAAVPEAAGVAIGDLSKINGIQQAAEEASELGPYDAVIHNAGVGSAAARHATPDNTERIFAVNVLGPYLLTALMPLPGRLVYLSSGLQASGRVRLDDLQWERLALERVAGVLRLQALRRAARLRGSPQVPDAAQQRRRPRLDQDQAGRQGSDTRSPDRCADPGMARHERRAGSPGHRPLLQVAPRPPSQPGGVRHRTPGRPASRLRHPDGDRTARSA